MELLKIWISNGKADTYSSRLGQNIAWHVLLLGTSANAFSQKRAVEFTVTYIGPSVIRK